MHCLPLVVLALFGGEQVIDDFRYVDAAAARQVWVAGEGTTPVDVAAGADRPVLKVDAPFGTQEKMARAVLDRKCQLDLSAPSGFALEVCASKPESIGYLSLYFRSGDGWHSAGKSIGGDGWQTLRFAKASFQTEGSPVGWRQIDGVRIAAWRAYGKPVGDTVLRFRRLAASWHEVAVVVPGKATASAAGEGRAVREAATLMTEMLEDLGLGADVIEEPALLDGALARRRVAILPYNPTLHDDTIAALARYVEGGGKLMVCYALPPRLAAVLGFGNPKYIRQNRPGQFAEMRCDARDVPGLPESVRQNSWNIMAVQPAGQHARVLGQWYDDAGKPSHAPAVLLSDHGAFVSHILLPDDREAKRQLLAAMVGFLHPALWEDMATAALQGVGRVGHCSNAEELRAYLRPYEAKDAVAEPWKSGCESWKKSQQHLAEKAYAQSTACARAAHQFFMQAYLRTPDSPKREARAVWNHSGTGAYPGDWNRSAKLLSENGFNMVVPNMLWGGLAHYASDVLPRSEVFRKYGDQIEACCAAAKKYGVEVHVWKVNFNLAGAPKDWVEKLRREGRTQMSVSGKSCDWLCPSHPQNRKMELESMLEVAHKYPIAGLHFDYIRYPGRETCYCDGCRQRFEAESGRKVGNWPDDCYSGPRKEEYNHWRCRQITALVEAVSREARTIHPGLKISAAVFGAYPGCRASVAQDWPEWIKAGYLDFVCPMDYTESDAEFVSEVQNQLRLVDGRIPLYPGIGATASEVALTADRVVGQIHLARTLGAAGFTIFNFDQRTADSIMPCVGLGAGSQPAVPPHRTP
jgi:uncharacterized lipoprotein YddW (UPF0748 family)